MNDLEAISAVVNADLSSKQGRDRARRDLTKQMNESSSSEDEETHSDETDLRPRVTTRRAWSDYCTNKSNRLVICLVSIMCVNHICDVTIYSKISKVFR